MVDIWDGIAIGGAGGAVAGLTVWLIQLAHTHFTDWRHKTRVYDWLKKEAAEKPSQPFRSTRAIASWNNLTEDRVRYICSHHKSIYLSTGENEDLWCIDVDNRGK